jgi:predicted enzyme related to lactoylglutathione lyase
MTVEEPHGEGLPGVVSGQLCYLQIPAADAVQSANFYAAVFGWGVEHTYASFEAPQMIGQWVEGRAPAAGAGMMLWINVDDLEEVIGLVLANGGEVLEPPAADGPTRMLATIRDPGGNPVGLAAHSHG